MGVSANQVDHAISAVASGATSLSDLTSQCLVLTCEKASFHTGAKNALYLSENYPKKSIIWIVFAQV